jgi:hypothetical protein
MVSDCSSSSKSLVVNVMGIPLRVIPYRAQAGRRSVVDSIGWKVKMREEVIAESVVDNKEEYTWFLKQNV